jgi:hypothetical protein
MQMDLLRITVLSNHESGAGQIKVRRVEIMGVATRGTSKCEQALPTSKVNGGDWIKANMHTSATHNCIYYNVGWRVDCLTCENRINDTIVMMRTKYWGVPPSG